MPKRILLADDSITIQKVVELTFSDGDYEIITANNGARALQKLSENTPDIILCDIIMPERNGYEVCEYVKSHPEYRDIPVILLTGTFEPFDPDRAEKAGCDAVVTKPFESQALINKVDELIERRRRLNEERRARPSIEPAQEPPAAASPPNEPAGWNIPTFTPYPDASPVAAPAFAAEEAPFGNEGWSEPPASSPSTSVDEPFASAPAFPEVAQSGELERDTSQVFTQEPSASDGTDSSLGAETRAYPLMTSEPQTGEPLARTLQFPSLGSEAEAQMDSAAPISPEPFIAGWTPVEEIERPAALPTQAIPVPSELEDAETGPLAMPVADEDLATREAGQDFVRSEPPFDASVEPAFTSSEEAAHLSSNGPDFGGPAFPSSDESRFEESEESGEPIYEASQPFESMGDEAPADEQPFAPAEEPELQPETLYEQPRPIDFPIAVPEPDFGAISEGPEIPGAAAHGEAGALAGSGAAINDADIDRIARRVVELMSDQLVRNIAWEVIPDVAEAVVRERVRELEGET